MEVPSLKATMSQVSPAKAAQIRSVVTGDLNRDEGSGLLCFERTVETTFVLPWDLNPKVQPEKLGSSVCSVIRGELMDGNMLSYLEECAGINWNNLIQWQYRLEGDVWSDVEIALTAHLEAGYCQGPSQHTFMVSFTTFSVDYSQRKLLNTSTNTVYELRRLAFTPLMPLKTERDSNSLYHAASLGFWGVHDRTSLLQQAVTFTLSDPKAQFMIYERWCQQVTRATLAKPEFPHWERAKASLSESPQLHIFTLSNVVQRPIIVYSHPNCDVGGVYLPLLWEDAHKQFPCDRLTHLRAPLVLGYNATTNHFCPLVTFKGSKGPAPLLHPLCHQSGKLLTVHFLSEAQLSEDMTVLLSRLLFVDLVPPTPTPHAQTLSAVSMVTAMPEVMDTLVKRYESLFL